MLALARALEAELVLYSKLTMTRARVLYVLADLLLIGHLLDEVGGCFLTPTSTDWGPRMGI